jgi:hypothetical protein
MALSVSGPVPAPKLPEGPMTTPSHPRSLPALLLCATLALAACGGSTPTSSPAAGATAAPRATSAPVSTTGAGATQAPGESAAGGGINLGGAAASLENLDNYSFKIAMASGGAAAGMMGLIKAGGSITMEGTVVLKPTQAADVVMTLSDGKAETEIGYRIIGDTAYTSFGGTWMSTPASDAEKAIDAYKPEKMLGSFSGMEGLEKVGEETKNGIACDHYTSTADPGAGASSLFGLPEATWQTDVWIATDGGFVVSAVMTATGKTDTGEAGSFTVSVDVTGVNTPNVTIEAPKDVIEIPS